MIPAPYNQPALEYALIENLARMLELGSPALLDRLMNVKPLRQTIDETIRIRLGPLDEVDPEKDQLKLRILQTDWATLEQVSRTIAVLSQASVISICTKGETLRLATQFCGTTDVLKVVRDNMFADMKILPPTGLLRQDVLELYASRALNLLLGLLGPGYLVRYALQFPLESIPAATEIPQDNEDYATFLAIAERAFELIPQEIPQDNPEEQNEEAQNT